MPALTPSFVMKFERRMRAIAEKEYARRASKAWAPKILRETPIEGAYEIISWFLSTATIEVIGPSGVGGMPFENMFTQTAMIAPQTAGKGIKVDRDQIEDLNGTGLNQLAEWSEQIAGEIAWYPQRNTTWALLNGANTDGSAVAYDGKPFFADPTAGGHPLNPNKLALGSYYNWFHGAVSGAYPGALPIHDALIDATHGVTMDTAVANLGKAMAAVASVKMPNGIDSRYLTPKYLIAPQQMAPRVHQLLDAKTIAQAAGTIGAGGANIEAVVKGFGLAEPIIAPDLGASFSYQAQIPIVNQTTGSVKQFKETLTGSDSTWYLVCAEAETSQLGGILHCMRRPFEIRYFTGMGGGEGYLQAYLARARQLEYQCDGRQSVQYGHPYTIFRFDAS